MYLKSDRNDTMKIFFVDKKIFKTVDNGTKICFLLIVEQIIVLSLKISPTKNRSKFHKKGRHFTKKGRHFTKKVDISQKRSTFHKNGRQIV